MADKGSWAGGNGGSGLIMIRYVGTIPKYTGGTVDTSQAGYIIHVFTTSGTLTLI